jgi:hypothetical protein
MGGAKLDANFRPGPESKGNPAARALRAIPANATTNEIPAVTSQVATHRCGVSCPRATHAAPNATVPITTPAHPDTAVNDTERSIVSLMKRRLSMERSCKATGSGAGRCRGQDGFMPNHRGLAPGGVKYSVLQNLGPQATTTSRAPGRRSTSTTWLADTNTSPSTSKRGTAPSSGKCTVNR